MIESTSDASIRIRIIKTAIVIIDPVMFELIIRIMIATIGRSWHRRAVIVFRVRKCPCGLSLKTKIIGTKDATREKYKEYGESKKVEETMVELTK